MITKLTNNPSGRQISTVDLSPKSSNLTTCTNSSQLGSRRDYGNNLMLDDVIIISHTKKKPSPMKTK